MNSTVNNTWCRGTTGLTWQRATTEEAVSLTASVVWWRRRQGAVCRRGPGLQRLFWKVSPCTHAHTHAHAAARNHDRRWRTQLSRRDKSSLEMEKRLIPHICVSFFTLNVLPCLPCSQAKYRNLLCDLLLSKLLHSGRLGGSFFGSPLRSQVRVFFGFT